MKYSSRIYYTEADKESMWDRLQRGESLHSVRRHFRHSHSSIQGFLSRTGGIRQPAAVVGSRMQAYGSLDSRKLLCNSWHGNISRNPYLEFWQQRSRKVNSQM